LANFRTLSAIFIALTVIFAASTGYLALNPTAMTQTTTITQTSTATKTVGASAPAYTVGLGYSSAIGFYLTNGTGFTLYMFKVDKPNGGTSACAGSCSNTWPPFLASSIKVPPGLNASSFGTITRSDGTMQVTYNGSPLYHFHSDTQPGSALGQGIGSVWYAYTVPTPHA
jgi:predicted lipoprotein with Yx(FWY)xxD motif